MNPGNTSPGVSDHAGWQKIQAGTGLAFTTFLVLHVANTFAGILIGEGAYNQVQKALRTYYQQPLIEPFLVVGSLAGHIAAGLKLRRFRRRQPMTMLDRLHRYSGYFLTSVVFLHMAATRGRELATGLPADWAYVYGGLIILPYVFAPYYTLLFLSGIFHMVYGVPRAVSALRRPPERLQSSTEYA